MKVVNRIFHRNYVALDRFEAGMVLSGAEVKSVRAGNIRLDNAFVRIQNLEAQLVNADIPMYQFARPIGYEPTRSRKLLLHKKEIIKLQTKLQSGGKLTIVPTSCYTKGHRIKLEVALAKARGEIGTKKLERARDIKLAQEQEMKEFEKR